MNIRFLEPFNQRMRDRRLKAQMRATGPITSVTDARFVYVRSEHSDIRQTFARIRREGSLLNPPQVNQKENP